MFSRFLNLLSYDLELGGLHDELSKISRAYAYSMNTSTNSSNEFLKPSDISKTSIPYTAQCTSAQIPLVEIPSSREYHTSYIYRDSVRDDASRPAAASLSSRLLTCTSYP
jgi:hypothetical protein